MDFGLAKNTFLCFIIVINLNFMSSLWYIDLDRRAFTRTELFMKFYIMNCIEKKGEVCRQLNYF